MTTQQRQQIHDNATPVNPPVASMVTCRECKTANDPNREFCASCGRQLWENCLECGKRGASTERFCGNCGANREELVENVQREIDQALFQVTQLERECRFEDAAAALQKLRPVDHPRLSDQFQALDSRITELSERAKQQQEMLVDGLRKIRAMVEGRRYEDAIRHLEKLPPTLRKGEAEELLITARSRQEEIDSLMSQVRTAVSEKKYLELAPHIERLKAIVPDHTRLEKLSRQIAQHVRRLAENLCAKHKYDEILRLVNAVPSLVLRSRARGDLREGARTGLVGSRRALRATR